MNFSRPSILARILSIRYLRYLPCDLDVFPPACSSSLSRWAFQRQILYLIYIAVFEACMAALSSAFCSISPIRYSSLMRRMRFLYSFLRFFTSYAAFSAFSLMALRSSSRPFTKSEHSSEPRGIHSSFQPLALLTNLPCIALYTSTWEQPRIFAASIPFLKYRVAPSLVAFNTSLACETLFALTDFIFLVCFRELLNFLDVHLRFDALLLAGLLSMWSTCMFSQFSFG